MKNKIFIIIGIIVILLITAGLFTSYTDSARVRNSVEPVHTIKIVSEDGCKVTYWGLGYKVIRYPSVSPNEPYQNNRGVKYGSWFMNYELIDDESDISQLQEKYPQFFNISTDSGLTVYIWQMSKNSYSCYLSNTTSEAISEDLYTFAISTTIPEMRAILNTYDIEKEEITIHPVKNLLSSYYYEITDKYSSELNKLFWKD